MVYPKPTSVVLCQYFLGVILCHFSPMGPVGSIIGLIRRVTLLGG